MSFEEMISEIATRLDVDYDMVRDVRAYDAGFDDMTGELHMPFETVSVVITQDGEDVLWTVLDENNGCPVEEAVETITKELSEARAALS